MKRREKIKKPFLTSLLCVKYEYGRYRYSMYPIPFFHSFFANHPCLCLPESVNIPRARAVEALKLFKHFDEFLDGQTSMAPVFKDKTRRVKRED